MRQLFSRFVGNAYGATAIEYALIAGSIALAIIATVNTLGDTVLGLFEQVAASFLP